MSDTMPERVWLDPKDGPGFAGEWHSNSDLVGQREICYVPESRLLAAEARVREVEAERRQMVAGLNSSTARQCAEIAALCAERDALQADLKALLVLVKHYEGYAVTAAIRAGVTDLRVGAPPEVLAAGKRYTAILDREGV